MTMARGHIGNAGIKKDYVKENFCSRRERSRFCLAASETMETKEEGGGERKNDCAAAAAASHALV
jgi:hypothetical protein